MIVQTLDPETVGLKTTSTLTKVNQSGDIVIGARSLEGPGEYDIAGVGAHILSGYGIFFCEGVRLAVVWDRNAKFTNGDDGDIAVLVFLTNDINQINTIISEQDPRVVIVYDQSIADVLTKQDGVVIRQENSYKVTAATLPAQEREFILLV